MKLSNELKVGIFALVALLAFVIGMNYMKGTNVFNNSLILYAKYEDVQGLIKGNSVMFKGIKIGKVAKMGLEGEDVLITLEIVEDIGIPADSKAEIFNSDLLGAKAVQIVFGKSEKPIETNSYIEGTIEQTMFAKAGGMVDKVGEKIPDVMDKLEDFVKKLTDSTNKKGVNEMLGDFKGILENTNNITKDIAAMDLQNTVKTLATSANKLLDGLNETKSSLDGLLQNAEKASADFPELTKDLKKVTESADKTMADLSKLTAKLNSTDNSLGKLLNGDELYGNLELATKKVNTLLDDVKEDPKRYVPNVYVIERRKKEDKKKD